MAEAEQIVLERFASARDPEAFRELVERHRDMVFAACHRVLGNPADAEDAAQECFLQLVRKADRLRAPISGWLHHVATQAAIDLLRRRAARASRDVAVARQRPTAQEPSWDDIKTVVDQAIAELPEELRAPIVLHYLEGRSLNETGAELGITGRAVSKRLARAVEQMQARLRKGGWVLGAAALGALLAANAAEAAPVTLVASLGKMALASSAASAVPGGAAKGVLAGKGIVAAAIAAAAIIAGAMTLLPPTFLGPSTAAAISAAPSTSPETASPQAIIEPSAVPAPFDVAQGAVSMVEPAQGPDVATRPRLKSTTAPGPEVLEGCKRLDVDPPAYMTAHYIAQAPPEHIFKAVAWIKAIEGTAYPTMVEILGHEPAVGLHAVVFRSDIQYAAGYAGIGQFQKTGYRASRTFVRVDKLDSMPPYQIGGGITWSTIHAFLDEAGHKADWKPIGEPEVLVNIFQMEFYKRLGMQPDLRAIWDHQVTRRPGTRTAVLGEFWKEYGWQPFQKLIVKLHENPDFKPTLDESMFAYEMSLNVGRDVSAFFEERGWNVSPETRLRIREQLNR